MSYVGKRFRHDVFVSYSHGDVQGDGRALLKQWSQGFAEQLERELQTYREIGGQLSIFLDAGHRPHRGVDPIAPLPDTLQNEISSSAILAVLMSEHYLDSEWCRQEREWWISEQRKLNLRHEDRIAVARIWPTGSKPWPEGLIDAAGRPLYTGVSFFDPARAETSPQPFSWPNVTNETTGDFREKLLEYVGRIKLRLVEFRNDLEQHEKRIADAQRLSAPGGQLIYLHGRKAHSAAWKPVYHELKDTGYTVIPPEPEEVEREPEKIRESRHERVQAMSACDAVLILGTEDVQALKADLTVIGRLERQEAIARSDRRLPCGMVDTSGVLRHTPDWPDLAKRLDVDWFDASAPPPLSPQIRAWLHGTAL